VLSPTSNQPAYKTLVIKKVKLFQNSWNYLEYRQKNKKATRRWNRM